ncbi:chondroitinase family polysaccharide lyase [Gramella sp. AN32]|uniref:Chondroitinase family polysaccharide lyase n=1 Tax=Christiangramia antarctica TaxID=2058158 RepID=A0ABW5X528_9FLAO|nr:chondroitinase family polysaccharide lyase [Gramella sp. AN32]MCM4157049.1 hypothetical protein [Gramella sp. AN32]
MIKYQNKYLGFLFLLVVTMHFPGCGYGQEDKRAFKESFEDKSILPKYETSGKSELSLTKKHRYFGESALQWEWIGNASFKTSAFRILPKEKSPLQYGNHFPASPTFIMSLYNEEAQGDQIKIAFLDTEGNEKMWFTLPLDFTGWRTIWVPFYEMKGSVPEKTKPVDFETMKIVSMTEDGSGKLYFDDIVFSQYQDDRHSYPDRLVPFIKADIPAGSDHWMPLIRDMERIDNIALEVVTQEEKQDLVKIEKRIDTEFDISKKSEISYDHALKEFNKLNLGSKKDQISGPPLTFQIDQVYFNDASNLKAEALDIKEFGSIIKKLANFYQRASEEDKARIADLFTTASKYYLDQGWQAGSSGGTRHHIGYGVRDLTDAFYMMKEPLKKAGILNEIGNSLKWLFNLGKILGPEGEFQANVDYYNTQSFYHLMLIFMTEDIREQAALLEAYSNYMSITLAQDDEKGVFKKDGTVWHHRGHYPAYGLGAFTSVPPVINILSATEFQISTEGHRNFKKAFMTTRLYSQLYDYGFGNAGRHPLEDNSIKPLRQAFLKMIYAGSPEHTSKIDREVAAAYLRLWGNKDPENTKIISEAYHVKAERLPGYKVFPFAATAVHRRDQWAAILKGYSKYVWASEIYVDENRYGRYPANGSIQLLNREGEAGSGFNQNGWDWNRYPGTTVIVLPFEELEIEEPLLMFKSAESFAGAVRLDKNGVFAMKLNESKGENADGAMQQTGFPGKLKANKSVFSFGDKLIAIGTGISSVDEQHPVQTNLFQNYLLDNNMPIYVEGEGMFSKFPFMAHLEGDTENGKWLLDVYNNAYHILSANSVQVKKQEQESYHNKYSIRTGKKNPKGKGADITEGDYAVAWLDHGKAPKDASYQYVIYPDLSKNERDDFPENIKGKNNFEILRADNVAHIVNNKEGAMTGFVVFDAEKELNNPLLKNVSAPSIIMIKNEGEDKLMISALNPDLNMPNFEDKTKSGLSLPVELSFTINGNWVLNGDAAVKSISSGDGKTAITVENHDGFAKNILLKKVEE